MYWNKFTREIVHKQNVIDPNMLVLLVGKSGSGKTTLEKELVNNFGFKSVKSYTTRPKRVANEENHQFVTKKNSTLLKIKLRTLALMVMNIVLQRSNLIMQLLCD